MKLYLLIEEKTVLFILSFRNLLRNRARLIINTLVVMIASCLLVVALGQIGGINKALTTSVTDTLTGHLSLKPEVAPVNFFQFESSKKIPLINGDDLARVISELRTREYIEAVTSRLRFGSLVGDDNRSNPAMVIGVDPQTEAAALPHMAAIIEPLVNDDAAIIARNLLRKSRLNLNEKIVIFSETPNDSFNAAEFTLENTIDTPVLIDEYTNNMVLVNIEAARRFLYLQDEASEIVIRLKPAYRGKEMQEQIKADIQTMLTGELSYLKAYTYSEVESSIENISSIASGMGFIQVGTIMVVMLVTVLILTSISLHERRFEIGTLMSLGMTPKYLTFMFLFEVLLKTTLGFVLGFLIGVAILAGINLAGGIQAATPIDQYIYGGKQMFPVIDIPRAFIGGGLMIIVAVLTTSATCISVARKDPVTLLNTQR